MIATAMTATKAATTRVPRRPDGKPLPGLARIMTAYRDFRLSVDKSPLD